MNTRVLMIISITKGFHNKAMRDTDNEISVTR